MTEIKQITDNKRNFMELLLLADEQEDMLLRYLDRGDMFALEIDGGTRAVCVVTDEGDSVLELKNIAINPEYQRMGLGRQLIDFIEKRYKGSYKKLIVGTGDSPLTIPFYESCGFVRTYSVKNFFTENYDHPIFEAGVQLIDMIYFEKRLVED